MYGKNDTKIMVYNMRKLQKKGREKKDRREDQRTSEKPKNSWPLN